MAVGHFCVGNAPARSGNPSSPSPRLLTGTSAGAGAAARSQGRGGGICAANCREAGRQSVVERLPGPLSVVTKQRNNKMKNDNDSQRFIHTHSPESVFAHTRGLINRSSSGTQIKPCASAVAEGCPRCGRRSSSRRGTTKSNHRCGKQAM
jgi:hypothetical protein